MSDHPITVAPNSRRVVVRFAGRTIADTTNAVVLHEASLPPVQYIPRADVDMTLLRRTTHGTHCPYKGDAAYYTIEVDGRVAENAVWTYEQPYPAVGAIRERLAFYPSRVDAIEELARNIMAGIEDIQVGYQVYAREGGEEFGAVRGIGPDRKTIMIYVENAGDFTVPLEAVRGVHDQKVLIDAGRVDEKLRTAIAHAHDAEEPGL